MSGEVSFCCWTSSSTKDPPLTFTVWDSCTDIGLPPGQTRDSTFNTNNWTESAFRTFDTVFLENRKNKRYCQPVVTLIYVLMTSQNRSAGIDSTEWLPSTLPLLVQTRWPSITRAHQCHSEWPRSLGSWQCLPSHWQWTSSLLSQVSPDQPDCWYLARILTPSSVKTVAYLAIIPSTIFNLHVPAHTFVREASSVCIFGRFIGLRRMDLLIISRVSWFSVQSNISLQLFEHRDCGVRSYQRFGSKSIIPLGSWGSPASPWWRFWPPTGGYPPRAWSDCKNRTHRLFSLKYIK